MTRTTTTTGGALLKMQQDAPTSPTATGRPRPNRRGPSGAARLGPAGELLRLVAVPTTIGPYVASAAVLGAIDVLLRIAR